MQGLVLDVLATEANFSEVGYLAANPDVAAAVLANTLLSGRRHFDAFGRAEGRRLRRVEALAAARAEKSARIERTLRDDLPRARSDRKFDFLSDELRDLAALRETDNVSSNDYGAPVQDMIARHGNGLLLDCGAGRRSVYYPNVVNFEIVDYDTTDVLGIGEVLPFRDASFDGVISIAVLEHVRDPFRCASEICRVLKPGGSLVCAVPFLQPEHGYPNHYYNMAPQGLRALFADQLVIDDHQVTDRTSPTWVLNWVIQSWADGLAGATREQFLDLPLRRFLDSPLDLNAESWAQALSVAKRFELASATVLFAHKPEA